MKFHQTTIFGAYLVDMNRVEDTRGFFARAWSSSEFGQMGLATDFPEVNFSMSIQKGTIRGFHYQKAPYQEAKFVRCVKGSLFEVVIDLRPESPTYLQWAGFEIRASNYQAIYIPAGCARGVQALEDNSEMLYMASACYQPDAEAGIRWNDPFFNVVWRDVGGPIVSGKDQLWADFVLGKDAMGSANGESSDSNDLTQ
ncbi:MAG: dTDP-4-dehydrorhamnose 3,5-epimerase family protein [Akkermansiaceae bacterium]|nr:dTDP-4-dehydrorhamnose 3,5-epimerase family protein [Akkermansiaceae bacterium]